MVIKSVTVSTPETPIPSKAPNPPLENVLINVEFKFLAILSAFTLQFSIAFPKFLLTSTPVVILSINLSKSPLTSESKVLIADE